MPRWIPDGYELTEVIITKNGNRLNLSAMYTDSTKSTIIIGIAVFSEDYNVEIAKLHEKDDGDVIEYNVNGVAYYIMTNNSRTKTVWAYDSYECFFSVPEGISTETVKQMIDSIYWEAERK
jgi:hypothetical protein